jgi:hypothetical protein
VGKGKKWPLGERKWRWAVARPKIEAGPNTSNKTFLNFCYLEFKFFLPTLEICARRFRRDFGMGIFPKFF